MEADPKVTGLRKRMLPVTLSFLLLVLALAAAGCAAPVQVEWTTETEMNTAGFNLYRGVSPDGPFDVKVNDQLIPPATDPMTGGQYSYTDRTARPGTTYYYQLQEVETAGGVNSFGPIEVQTGWLTLPGPLWAVALIVLALAAVILWVHGGRQTAKCEASPKQTPMPDEHSCSSY